jgi:ankyrin repeat protein
MMGSRYILNFLQRWKVASVVCLGLGVCGLSSCGDAQSRALRELKDQGYALDVGDYFRAAGKGDLSALSLFEKAGMALDVRDQKGGSALVEAIKAGQDKAVAHLLGHGVRFETQVLGLQELLKVAIQSRNEATVEILLAQGAVLSDPSKREPGCLQLAAGMGSQGIVSLLIPHFSAEKDLALIAAGASGDVPTIDVLLQADANLFARETGTGNTALHRAAMGGHVDAVSFLFRSGANRMALNSNGYSAFQLAEKAGHAGVLEVLRVKPIEDELEPTGKIRLVTIRGSEIDLRSRILWQGRSLGELLALRSVREARAPFFLERVEGPLAHFVLRGTRPGVNRAGAGDQFEGFVVEKVMGAPEVVHWWDRGAIVRSRSTGNQVLAVPGVTIRSGILCGIVEINGDDVRYEVHVGDQFKCKSDSEANYRVESVSPTTVRIVAIEGQAPEIVLRTGSTIAR